MSTHKLPQVSLELIEYLEGIHPDKSPTLNAEDRRIWFDAGKVDLVRHLRMLHDEQHQTVLSKEL